MIHVLIAEDQTILREALSSLLNLEDDISVAAKVGTGGEVLNFPYLNTVHLFLLDIEMPDGNGLEVAEKLKAINKDFKIALLTTFSRSGYIEKAMEIGVEGYLLKDEPIENITKAIRRIAAGEKVISSMLGRLFILA